MIPSKFFTSLAGRLGWSFTVLAVLAMLAAGVMHDRSMSKMLAARGDAELIAKAQLVRHLLTTVDSIDAIRESPQKLLGAVVDQPGISLIVRSAQGDVLATNVPLAEASGIPSPAPGLGPVEGDRIRDWVSPSRGPQRVVAARGKLPLSDTAIEIFVSRNPADSEALLDAIRHDMLLSLGAASLAAALIGHVIVRRGLRPVREAATKARKITASRLSERLDVANAPDELKDLVESFNQMLDRLQDAFQRLSQFSSDLAHEFRSPISNLMVQSQVAMARPRSNEEYQTLLASNIEEFERLSRMIESMLFLARADNAEMVLAKEPVDAAEELGWVVEYFEGPADEAGVKLIVDADGVVVADRSLLRRAVSNLVANALRFTPQGGTISIVAKPNANDYVIRVQNTGPGISPEHRDRIFDRFYRGDPTNDASVSTGLGLALVRSIMELHRGQARLNSTPTNTTEFELSFPLKPSAP